MRWLRTGSAWAAGGPRGDRRLMLPRDHQRSTVFLQAGQFIAWGQSLYMGVWRLLNVGSTATLRAVCGPFAQCRDGM